MLANAATMRILVRGGKVVNDDCTLEADVYIENGVIQQVGRELMIPGGAKVIDATGKLVLPGGIDTSTHFHQTFMNATCVDDFYHGTKVPPCFCHCPSPCQGALAGRPSWLQALSHPWATRAWHLPPSTGAAEEAGGGDPLPCSG